MSHGIYIIIGFGEEALPAPVAEHCRWRTMRLPISICVALLLIAFMSGCGTKDLQFTQGQGCWETTTELPDSPFGQSKLKIQVFNERIPTSPPRRDQLALIQRVRESLPKLMPVVVQKLTGYDEDLKAPKVFREQLVEPSICLFSPEENPSHAWSLTVERPSHGSAFGYHLEFVEMEFKEIWAGD